MIQCSREEQCERARSVFPVRTTLRRSVLSFGLGAAIQLEEGLGLGLGMDLEILGVAVLNFAVINVAVNR